ncbi:Phosphogluconate dehydratase [compost metagenome]
MRDGDRIRVDAVAGVLQWLGDEGEFAAREPAPAPADDFARFSLGRGLFGSFRRHARIAEEGGSALDLSEADAGAVPGASAAAAAAQTVAQ